MRRRRRHNQDNDEQERYYLLPGQGGRMYRQKQKVMMKWSLAAGCIVALIMAAVMYLVNRFGR
jgi:hypothetical protein